MKQSLVLTILLFISFLWNRSCQTLSLGDMLAQGGTQPSIFEGGLDDLEAFQAWAKEIKTYMSQTDPSLYEVLEVIASSKQRIEEKGLIQASQDALREQHRALRVLQAKTERASFTEEKAHQLQLIDEHKTTEADKLQRKNEERQLGCLLVQKTKGETQLQVSRWLSTANSWEAWRQLNLQYASKWSIHFELLASIMNTSFDTQPAFFLQQLSAWKEQVVRYQQLSGEHLPDFIKLTAVVNGLKGSVRHFVLLSLDSDSSFGDLDSLLATYFSNIHDQHESSLNSLWDRACRDKPEETCKGKGQKSNPSFKQQLEQGGKRKKRGKEKEKSLTKEKVKLTLPSLQPTKARGSMHSFQQDSNGATYAGRKGIEPKLAGGTTTSSINSSTYSNKLGTTQASCSNGLHKLQRRDLKIKSTR